MNRPSRKSRMGAASSVALLLAALVPLVSAGCRARSPRQSADSTIVADRRKSADSTVTAGPKDQPAWVRRLIGKFESEPVSNPPHQIVQFRYRNQRVYYVPPECCDQMSTLYDSTGARICSPDGGMTGKGDGQCADFFTASKDQTVIWKDSRTWPPPKNR